VGAGVPPTTRMGRGLSWTTSRRLPARGLVLEVFRHDDDAGKLTFASFAETPLPLQLVERFIALAGRGSGEQVRSHGPKLSRLRR
jgi:hypothetical protein